MEKSNLNRVFVDYRIYGEDTLKQIFGRKNMNIEEHNAVLSITPNRTLQ